VRPGRGGDLFTIGGDHAPLGERHRLDALPYTDDQGESGEKTKGFSGEAARAQSSWDHGERPHTRRSDPDQRTGGAATITLRNVFGPFSRRNCGQSPRPHTLEATV
jgi:hypothetical protein